LRVAPVWPAVLDRRRERSLPLAFAQLPFLAGDLAMEARLGDTLSPLGLRAFKCVEATSDRLPVDTELVGELGLLLASANASADPLHLRVGQFGRCRHTNILPLWDISWDI
jgi:hypothetical protein